MSNNTRTRDLKAALAPPEGRFTSYGEAEALVIQLEQVLREHGFNIERSSELECACLATMDFYAKHRDPSLRTDHDLRDPIRRVVGLLQLVQLILRARDHTDFAELLAHLALLNAGSPTQNTRAPAHDQASNKLFELLVALAVMGCGSDVRLDSPSASDGKNPDVIARMPDARRWGFACKVIHGDAPMTLFERIEDGVEQIERSTADTGIVVINFKNRIPHDDFFPLSRDDTSGERLFSAFVDPGAAARRLAEFVEARTITMEQEVGREPIIDLFRGKKALPGILVVVEATVGVVSPRGPAPTMIGFLHLITLESPEVETAFNSPVMAVIDAMNASLQLRPV